MKLSILTRPFEIPLGEIKKLWRANAAMLGFFPAGAFDEYAERGSIIAAFNEMGVLAGYLLYRKSGERLSIVHLCVRDEFQRRGLARTLFNKLLEESKSFRGISVYCRRDFSASAIWPRLGFVAVQEKRGRAIDSTVLTNWLFDCGNPDLFSSLGATECEQKLTVVIDANVFFDLHSPVAPDTEESKALMADWLQSSVEFCITPETLNEINRNKSQSNRSKYRHLAERFTVLRCRYEKFTVAEHKVKLHYAYSLSESDRSDIRQLAWAIASGHRYFLTRDENVLNLSAVLDQEFGMSVLRPSDLIAHLDELQERSKYNPTRVAGVLTLQRLKQTCADNSLYVFQASERGETKRKFRERLRKYLAMPKTCECLSLFWEEMKPAALWAYDRSSQNDLVVPFIRVPRGPDAITIVRNLFLRLVQKAAEEKRERILITDPYCLKFVEEELNTDGFIQVGQHWIKHTMPMVITAAKLIGKMRAMDVGMKPEQMPSLSETIRTDARVAQRLERVYWPLKISDAPLPSYIIPIRPRWAAELFDDELANQDLYGARTRLSLNRLGVYYRSAALAESFQAPGRILWYVSADTKYQGTKCIRACSFLDEVVTGRPKQLYRRFKKFGVYKWEHLIELARGNINTNIMAIQYSDTQLMTDPISWVNFQTILREFNVRTQLQSPQKVPSSVFAKLYGIGMGY